MSTAGREQLLLGVSPHIRGMSALADLLSATAFLPDRRSLLDNLHRARQAQEPVGLVLPTTEPDLILLALVSGVDRLAVYHGPTTRSLSGRERVLLRSAFAAVDLTVTQDAASEAEAISLGADPERIAGEESGVRSRLFREPRRRAPKAALSEALLSMGLDVLAHSGVLSLLERAAPKGVNVVNYHRILPLSELRSYYRPQMALGAPVFEAQLRTMGESRGFVPVDRMRDRDAGDRVAITFDDGYEDNFRIALPILERFSAPACIFVVTGLIGRPDALWWDRVGLSLFAWWKSGATTPLPPGLPPRTAELMGVSSHQQARRVISDVLSDLNQVSQAEREIAVAAASSLIPKRSFRTMLTWREVDTLKRAGISFGSHTQSHVPLDELPLSEAKEELIGGHDVLERRVGQGALRATALPRGELGPVSESDLRDRFEMVMTTEAGVNPASETSVFVKRRDGRMLTLSGRHHPAKLRLELTGLLDPLREIFNARATRATAAETHSGSARTEVVRGDPPGAG